MRSATRWLSVAILLAAGGWVMGPLLSAQGQKSVPPPIKSITDAYTKAVLAGDAPAVAMLYAEDAVEMPPNRPLIKGRAAIQQYYDGLFKQMKPAAFTLTHLDSHLSADHGHDVGTYRQNFKGSGAADAAREETGKYTVIVRRVGTEWKVVSAIYNSDQPAMK